MTAIKRQNFNITPEQEYEIAQLKELINAPTIKDVILSAVRFYAVIASEVKKGCQIYLASRNSSQMHKLIIPELEAITPSPYKYLVQRPHHWRQQLYVKGRRLPAASVYRDYTQEGRTPEQLAKDWELPINAIYECIQYCQENQALLQMEAEEDARRIAERGITIDSSPTA